jgi:hypothetical protein
VAVGEGLFDAIRARPTRAAIDLVVGLVATEPIELGVIRVERLLSDLAGAKFPFSDASAEQRATAVKAWWGAHADKWTPPERDRDKDRRPRDQ